MQCGGCVSWGWSCSLSCFKLELQDIGFMSYGRRLLIGVHNEVLVFEIRSFLSLYDVNVVGLQVWQFSDT